MKLVGKRITIAGASSGIGGHHHKELLTNNATAVIG